MKKHHVLRSVLILLLLIATLVTFYIARRLIINNYEQESSQLLGVYQSGLLTTVEKFEYFPAILTFDPRFNLLLKNNQIDQDISSLLEKYNLSAGSDEIFIMNAEGITLASSNYQDATSFVGRSYAFRPYFADAMRGKTGFYYAVGVTTGKAGLFISAPIWGNGNEILGVAVVKVDLTPLQQSWIASRDNVWLSGPNDIIFLSSDPGVIYRSLVPISDTIARELSITKQYGNGPVTSLSVQPAAARTPGQVTLEDHEYLLFSQPVKRLPWDIHRLVSLQDINNLAVVAAVVAFGTLLLAVFIALYYREILRKRQAELALLKLTEESEAHQRSIIENTNAGLMTLNERLEITEVNPKAIELFGMDQEHLHDILPLNPERLLQPWFSQITEESLEARGSRNDGTDFPLLYSLSMIKTGPAREYLLSVHDVSELKAAEAELVKANEELEARVEQRSEELRVMQEALMQERKLSAMGRMSAAIAHELNQPLTALSSYVATGRLYLAEGKPEKSEETFDKMEGLVHRIARISSQLKTFAAIRRLTLQEVSLEAAMRYAMEVMEHRIRDLQVDTEVVINKPVTVIADQNMLEQVLVNLLDNALDAVKDVDSPKIVLNAMSVVDKAWVKVRDNGSGMNQDQMDHLFDPFYTTKTGGKGLGLGLAISYSLLQDMQGTISVSSTEGEGSEFTLILPLKKNVSEESGEGSSMTVSE
ncbi:PAS domain-containing sensor histidine kinase [Hahella sp. CCB-MM4]|uniref:sensor histidine kinase n=1 Tax=Hahella sp. (strain CCB-MM4) TaxID=1926491 RepID=UPI000B9BC9B6|nr:ATP-binding protein [Hahella sp. CCB-MM4]OZG75003.1 PAS domain-containing sensor histidine kinase [Hahella sp. CCB-MM4]